MDSGNSKSLHKKKTFFASIPDSLHTAKIGNKVGWLSILVWVMLIHRRDYNATQAQKTEEESQNSIVHHSSFDLSCIVNGTPIQIWVVCTLSFCPISYDHLFLLSSFVTQQG